jgi:hypothetical protein
MVSYGFIAYIYLCTKRLKCKSNKIYNTRKAFVVISFIFRATGFQREILPVNTER